ncbi:MAG: FAD-dependent oxidoreductase, partial [Halocynthiibacter sp.]
SHLLIAAGRKPNIGKLDLDVAGVVTLRGVVKVDASLRSTNRRIYAVGDVAGAQQFTHLAGYHAGVVIRAMLFGLRSRARTDHIPRVTYTDPELAQIGLSETQARATHDARLEVVRFDMAENDRARTEGRARGLIKLMVVRGRPVGVSIAGPQAGELINLWALVLANRLKIGAVANMVSPYPTLGEVNKRVAGAYYAPRLFENPKVKHIVRFVQKYLP